MKTKKMTPEEMIKNIKSNKDGNCDFIKLLESLIENKTKKLVDLKDYYHSMMRYLVNDMRFSYRVFRLMSFESVDIYCNVDNLTVIGMIALSLINELEYKNPVDILAERIENAWKITYEVLIKQNSKINTAEINDGIRDREAYIACLCKQDENDYNISVKDGKLKLELLFYEIPYIEKEIAHQTFDKNQVSLIEKCLDTLFKATYIEEGEIEQEE